MLAVIAASSAFGLQIYTWTPRVIFWGILAVVIIAVVLILAYRLPKGVVTRPLVLMTTAACVALAAAVASGVLTPAEVIHVPLFAGLGATIQRKDRHRNVLVWLAAASVGDEVFQAILPYRTGSVQDVALNFASATAGYFLAATWSAASKR
jgi:predicted histidine transporter YuiF (NhaC family)